MCMSPHEMKSEHIQEEIDWLVSHGFADKPQWSWRIEEFEKILKERAEAG